MMFPVPGLLRRLLPLSISSQPHLATSYGVPMSELSAPASSVGTSLALTSHFLAITDPRMEGKRVHLLIDIIMIAICAVIAGADSWVDIEDFGKAKQDWLATFLELGDIPSHDTFGRVFSLINPKQFQESFSAWMQSVTKLTHGQVISIDGKTNRRTFGGKTTDGLTKALHLVSAFATANGVALGQINTNQKSNEITAIPELLKLLDIKGCLITTDAMGCQTDIAADIIARGGDYLLAVKGNQKGLYVSIKALFANEPVKRDINVSQNQGHGRIEQRTCEVITGPIVLERLRHKNNWVGLATIVKVTSQRTVTSSGETHKSHESRYYICSVKSPTAQRMQQSVREHWGVENNLHWTIDMAFREDESRIRTGHSPANMAVLRHIALNLIRSDKTRTVGIKASRLKAGWDTKYLEALLGGPTD
jgi:predicted transposase YbfD/YdcC